MTNLFLRNSHGVLNSKGFRKSGLKGRLHDKFKCTGSVQDDKKAMAVVTASVTISSQNRLTAVHFKEGGHFEPLYH
ncbi:hypothetical protein AVEN_175210-1 [Araneus ventricosus]|uniref:Uncharacterized protein n=1 Tax=Araneus ventricosus TaxID=182803 RepID=A0A4Y2URT8_ARAVE|nr:hypothetical protein AVEN_175210-1 [Araneus ventricosus]